MFIRKGLSAIASLLPDFTGKNFIIRGSKDVEDRYLGNSNIFNEDERMDYLNGKYKNIKPSEFTKPFFDDAKNQDDITKNAVSRYKCMDGSRNIT
jgi:asparagine synthase (glutamine-hydrolysing)